MEVEIVRPLTDGVGVAKVRVGMKPWRWLAYSRATDPDGAAFAVVGLGRQAGYHVRATGPGSPSCECLGFLRWGKCRHVIVAVAATDLDATVRNGPPPGGCDDGTDGRR